MNLRILKLHKTRRFHTRNSSYFNSHRFGYKRRNFFIFRRCFGGGNSFFIPPKITIFRLFLTGGATGVGYISYKVNSFSDWLKDSLEIIGLECSTLVDRIFGTWGGFTDEFGDFLKGIKVKKQPGIIQQQHRFQQSPRVGEVTETESERNVEKEENIIISSIETNNFNEFIRKMIQIREVLRISGNEDAINLPNIVVIGSQSSGKSSVLENLVGHEFLPKGQNMVTRRPLELTLVNTPDTKDDDFSVIISQYDKNVKLRDFAKIQSILKDLNLAVPDGEWISSEPIRLTIYSKNVPDLTLIDLPGYIQVTNKNQPPILRDKIRELCDRYIKKNNIILAVSAADVDLANSEAIKASRRFDPKGERTIGVITKLDLVDPEYAAKLVTNEDYPLKLGYIGVVCKPNNTLENNPATSTEPLESSSSSIFSRILHKKSHESTVSTFETEYFNQINQQFVSIKDRLGFSALRNLLTAALEDVMSKSLDSVVQKVEIDLDELKYQLKAQYNDRFVSAEAYVSDLISVLKHDFGQISRRFTRNYIDTSLRDTFNEKLINLFDENIWRQQEQFDVSQHDDQRKKLNVCLNNFTRFGVGRFTASLISDAILVEIEKVLKSSPFTFHTKLNEKILSAAHKFSGKKCQAAIEQVENSMKPYKQGIEFTPREWMEARTKLLSLLAEKENNLKGDIEEIKREIGSKRLKRAIEHLSQKTEEEQDSSTTSPIATDSNTTLMKAKEVVLKSALLKRMAQRREVLKLESKQELDSVSDFKHRQSLITRILSLFKDEKTALKSTNTMMMTHSETDQQQLVYEPSTVRPSSASEITIFKDPCQEKYPEIYLYLVMDRFLRTCSTFIHYELVSEFLQPFPNDVISADPIALDGQGGILSLTKMSSAELRTLLLENPEIAAHLSLQDKYRALERALVKLKEMKKIKV